MKNEWEPRVRVNPDLEKKFPGTSVLATECIVNFTFFADRLDAYGESLVREHDIPSVAAFNVLEILRGAGEPLPPSAIAERMIVARGTMTGILNSLQRRGLIRRIPHREDGRMVLIEMTSEGAARLARLLPQLHQAEKRVMDCLTESQQRSLLRMLATLQAHLLDEVLADHYTTFRSL
jgi:DNA-binding MarR family transcriptional regulator